MIPPNHPIVGILGGMGPEATVELMRRLIARTPAQDDQDHLHLLVDCNPKIPSRIAHLVDGVGIDPTDELVRMARNLESGGATLLAMPCNTAHGYAAAIGAAVGIPLINMVEQTAAAVMALGVRRVALLASSAVVKTQLYARAIDHFGGQIILPSQQSDVMDIIWSVKRGVTGPVQSAALGSIMHEMAECADVVVIACTELSVIAQQPNLTIPVIDALDVLTTAILRAVDITNR